MDANFEVYPGGIRVVPDKDGLGVNVPATAKALLAAARLAERADGDARR